ncbi:nucleotidyltransferase family protein [Bacillus sp. ISL-37]|uniref:nucleotidyltransferase domain-containing protein n=1 Tax=Bacillus sp. ISL-37 TaxID=2819123 RepID=UPI001BE4EBEC|nr:nucleotidyltransferase family protein [Bacillus sp. ISL-37]MBT2686223.1 nucleotidyltransferase family protein [Bacillus sp. ISL-37]
MDKNIDLDLAYVPRELKVQLGLLSKNAKEVCFEGLNWDLFIDLAMHHRTFPVLYPKLKQLQKEKIPEFVMKTLEMQYKQNTFRMLQLCAEMEQVSALFSMNDIKLLVLKGPVLASDLYGDLSRRTCGDLDVLIPINDLQKVEDLLLQEGYRKDDYIHTVLGDWKWRHHHVTYFHETKPIKLEIHWRLNPGPGVEPAFEELWARKRVSSLTKTPVYYLGKEDLFTFLVSHGARHGWSRLRWLMDISQMAEQEMDWQQILSMFGKYSSRDVAGQALILAAELLGSRQPEGTEQVFTSKAKTLAQEAIFYFEKMVNLHNDPVPDEVASFHKEHLFSLMSKKQKALFILSFLYPYPEDAETLPLPKPLHFLYFPLRPCLVVWRRTRKQVIARRIS